MESRKILRFLYGICNVLCFGVARWWLFLELGHGDMITPEISLNLIIFRCKFIDLKLLFGEEVEEEKREDYKGLVSVECLEGWVWIDGRLVDDCRFCTGELLFLS
jgi:hypothetical protein